VCGVGVRGGGGEGRVQQWQQQVKSTVAGAAAISETVALAVKLRDCCGWSHAGDISSWPSSISRHILPLAAELEASPWTHWSTATGCLLVPAQYCCCQCQWLLLPPTSETGGGGGGLALVGLLASSAASAASACACSRGVLLGRSSTRSLKGPNLHNKHDRQRPKFMSRFWVGG
jgi:hypothetical protein